MEQKQNLTLVAQADAYFYELISAALFHQNVKAKPETEFYLVNLMNGFIAADKLRQEPLALMVKEALEHPEISAQRSLLREIGDVSLYVAGFFQDSLARKLVDVDYYIDMGGTAYQQVAVRADETLQRTVYEELAAKFGSFVDVIAEVSDKTTQKSEKNLLRMYDLWVKTRSERAAKALQEAGILPNETIKKNLQ